MNTLFYLLVVIFFPLTNLVELEEDLMFIPPPSPPMELLKVCILPPPPPKSSNPPPPNNDMEVVCPPEITNSYKLVCDEKFIRKLCLEMSSV